VPLIEPVTKSLTGRQASVAVVLSSVLLFGAAAVASGQDQDQGAELDRVEALGDLTKPWLAELERWITEGGEPPVVGEPFGWWIQGTGGTERALLGARLERTTGRKMTKVLARDWALKLNARGGTAYSKIVSTQPKPPLDMNAVDIGVRLELSDARTPMAWSAVAELTVNFYGTATGEIFADRVVLTSLERVELDRPLLVEKTAALFAGEPDAAKLLSVGMDRWAQRLDDSGLTAWFGHQGLAVGDANGDGWDDLYVAMPSGLPNLLLVSQPDGTVRNVAEAAGVAWLDDTKGVLFVDVNGDGRDDIVSALGHVIVVQYGTEKGSFEVGGFCVAPDETPFYGVSASDFDGDGDLDIYGSRYVRSQYGESVPIPFHEARNGPSNHFFRNTERGFVDVTAPLGLRSPGGERFTLAAHFIDLDGDGRDELYVVNDFGSNQLFEFAGGKYRDRTAKLGVADAGAGMGASWSDYDLDGDLDLYVTNMFSSAGRRVAFTEAFAEGRPEAEREGIQRLSLGNTLLRRDGDSFTDVADASRTRMGRWAWGAVFADLNCDGNDDLLSPAGFLTGPKPGDL
jgi:hypothetical protein